MEGQPEPKPDGEQPIPEENACLLNPNVASPGSEAKEKEALPGNKDVSPSSLILVWFASTVKKSAQATRDYVHDWKRGKEEAEEVPTNRTITNDPYPGDLWTAVTCFCFALLGISGLMLELGPGYFNSGGVDMEDGEFDFEILQVFIVMVVFCLAFWGSGQLIEIYKSRGDLAIVPAVLFDLLILSVFPLVKTWMLFFHWALFSWASAVVLTLMLRLAAVYRKLKALRRQDVLVGEPRNDQEDLMALQRRRSSGTDSLIYQSQCMAMLVMVCLSLHSASADTNAAMGYFPYVVLGCNMAFMLASGLRLCVAGIQDWRAWEMRQERKQDDEVWNHKV